MTTISSAHTENLRGFELVQERGLLIDRTMTHQGREFYFIFTQLWNSQKVANPHDITVLEKPLLANQFEITITHKFKTIYRAKLSARQKNIKPHCEEAVSKISQHIALLELNMGSSGSPDLAKDEI